jgi:outer membrane protein TolC
LHGLRASDNWHAPLACAKAGAATPIGLLDTQRQRISAKQNLSQAETMLIGDFVGIQKALGLGWSG